MEPLAQTAGRCSCRPCSFTHTPPLFVINGPFRLVDDVHCVTILLSAFVLVLQYYTPGRKETLKSPNSQFAGMWFGVRTGSPQDFGFGPNPQSGSGSDSVRGSEPNVPIILSGDM
jgi:hypothetical protein